MDNQTPTQTMQAQSAPAQTPVPKSTAPTSSPVTEQKPIGGSKMKFIIIGVVIVLVLVLAGVAYWFRQNQTAAQNTVESIKGVEQLNTELNSLSVDDIESDFSPVDTELQGL